MKCCSVFVLALSANACIFATAARELQQASTEGGTDAPTRAPTSAPTPPTSAPVVPGLTRKTLTLPRNSSNGARLTFSTIDVGKGPSTILMLHGFPDSAGVFREQIPKVVAAGFRVIAPDLRGFGLSDKPQEVGDYALSDLVADVAAVLVALKAPTNLTAIVAHDQGTAIGTYLAAFNGKLKGIPFMTNAYVMMSMGHTSAISKYSPAYNNAVRQYQMSWYTMYFSSPLAEQGISYNDFEWYRTIFAPTTPPDIVEEQVKNLKKPVGAVPSGSLTAALNWYRNPTTGLGSEAFNVPSNRPATMPEVPVKTLALLGANDVYVSRNWMRASAQFFKRNQYTLAIIPDAGHWLPLEAPGTITDMLLDFVKDIAPYVAAIEPKISSPMPTTFAPVLPTLAPVPPTLAPVETPYPTPEPTTPTPAPAPAPAPAMTSVPTEPETPEPTTAVPTTAEPTTAVPTTAVPTTAVPTTAVPTTAVPTTAVPTTPVPTTPVPTTPVPTTPVATTAVPTFELAP